MGRKDYTDFKFEDLRDIVEWFRDYGHLNLDEQ